MLENFVQAVIARRRWVLVLSFILTALAIVYATHLRIVILPASLLPQSHPFVASKAILENVFGEKYTFIVAVTPKI